MNLVALMNRSRWPLVACAALCSGLLAVVAVRIHIAESIASQLPASSKVPDEVDIVVAKVELAAGTRVSDANMAIRRVPSEYRSAQAIAGEQFESRRGHRLVSALKAGDPLLVSNLELSEPADIASQLSPDVRALSINVDEVNSISGLLRPGDRIDLHVSVRQIDPLPGSPPMQSELASRVLENIRVLATGRNLRAVNPELSGRSFTAVTVEVTPEQAQRLIVAQRHGRLTALLRPAGTVSTSQVPAMNLTQALRLEVNPPARASAADVEIIEGGRGPLAAGTPVNRPGRAVHPAAMTGATGANR